MGIVGIRFVGSLFCTLFSVVFPVCAPEGRVKMTKKMDTTTIGGRIKKRRNDLGLSQENLAEKLFTSKQMISSYENNKTELKVQVVKELAVALGTTSSFLIDGNEAVTYKQETAELVALFNSISKEEVRKIAIEQLRLLTRIHIQQ